MSLYGKILSPFFTKSNRFLSTTTWFHL